MLRLIGWRLPQMALSACIPLAILVFVVPADWISGVIMVLSAPLIPMFMIRRTWTRPT